MNKDKRKRVKAQGTRHKAQGRHREQDIRKAQGTRAQERPKKQATRKAQDTMGNLPTGGQVIGKRYEEGKALSNSSIYETLNVESSNNGNIVAP